ncbi:hypothetical protein KQX54_009382 [Cotesia glomerata]|uniref:Uncharacterized protein n=1 Tax=Cotesia glomerata TaxID=32391 RepID=A0AAV7ICR1_COTGL|nr:hypothetical protein KQX54_009382 [Cotesia glomerata]
MLMSREQFVFDNQSVHWRYSDKKSKKMRRFLILSLAVLAIGVTVINAQDASGAASAANATANSAAATTTPAGGSLTSASSSTESASSSQVTGEISSIMDTTKRWINLFL